jgi:hypothetical protein
VSPPAVVIAFDPEECALPDVGEIVPWASVDELLFVGGEELFGYGVIVAGSASPQGATCAISRAEVGEFFRGVLAAAVAIKPNSV